MIKIKIISAGKLKEKYLIDGINEYAKRLQAFCKLEFHEVKDERIPDHCSKSEEEMIKEKEGKRLLSKVKEDEFLILLDLEGKQLSSVELASHIQEKMISGISSIAFIIGGSLGVSNELKQKANYKLSFSKLTFPHQLMKLILLEQIYRSFKIMNDHTYHK